MQHQLGQRLRGTCMVGRNTHLTDVIGASFLFIGRSSASAHCGRFDIDLQVSDLDEKLLLRLIILGT